MQPGSEVLTEGPPLQTPAPCWQGGTLLGDGEVVVLGHQGTGVSCGGGAIISPTARYLLTVWMHLPELWAWSEASEECPAR